MKKKELLIQCLLEGLSNRLGPLMPIIELERLTNGLLTKAELNKNIKELQNKGLLTQPRKDYVLLKEN